MLFLSVTFATLDPPPTQPHTLSLHDALPISSSRVAAVRSGAISPLHPAQMRWRQRHASVSQARPRTPTAAARRRSEEHTSELQSPDHLVCRLLLEKKKKKNKKIKS